MAPEDIGDKGGGPPAQLYIEDMPSPSTAVDKTDPPVTARNSSLVGLRRMMFENIAHTDDDYRPGRRSSDPRECEKSDAIDDQPARISLCDKKPVDINSRSSDRLSLPKIQSDLSNTSNSNDIKSDLNISQSDDKITEGGLDSSACSSSHSQYIVAQSVLGRSLNSNSATDIYDKDEFCSLSVADDLSTVEAENSNINAHINLDVDCDLDPNSCSSDNSFIHAQNIKFISNEEISYNILVESKESIVDRKNVTEAKNDVLINESQNAESWSNILVESKESIGDSENIAETKNDVLIKESQNAKCWPNILVESKESIGDSENIAEAKSEISIKESQNAESWHLTSETEILITRSESVSIKDEEVPKEEDEFTSLTHNIEQLVIDAKNEEVVKSVIETEGDANHDVVDEIDVNEPIVPKPTERTIKHKPPTPSNRKVRKSIVEPNEDTKKLTHDYPEELNPFGDDETEQWDDKVLKNTTTSLNPFGSSDEEEDVATPTQAPKPTARKVVPAPKSLNPFWSGDEEEEEESSLPPVPKPRKLRTPQPSPEPSPRLRRSLRSATGSLGSATSLASRKKKQAPLPPSPASPYQTLTLPGSRKSYSAPKPPIIPRTVTPSPPPLPISSPPSSHPSSPTPEGKLFEWQRQNSIVSETSSVGTIGSYTPHKSTYGQWKRKKGPAPARPVPVRRAVQPMPLVSVKQELADIEVKVNGLERQGVKLEQTIRDKFEQAEGASLTPHGEEMVLQLFELVNEKNELFRRQAELMYLRRQHNLEEEHAELEYQIRCLMLCPERNKTDSDKTREEQLIQRLVEVVERRNEIIDCLEMDRLREREEDRSVGTQLGIFSAVGSEVDLRTKTDKKEKKTKKDKRWSKKEVDKDVVWDESLEKKKSKKKWFTLHHSTRKS